MLPLLIPIGLAIAGALVDKKQPLRGAALGAAAGFTGGAALGAMGAGAAGGAGATGGLLGAGGATAGIGGAAGGTQAGLLAAQEAGLGATGSLGWGGATTGVQGGLNSMMGADMGAKAGGLLSTANDIGQPVSQAMQTAQMFKPKDQPPPMPQTSIQQPVGGAQSLSQLAVQNQQMAQQQQMQDWQKRQEQRKRIARMGMGGFYG